MKAKMKNIAGIVCISTIFLAPVARIGGDDSQQVPSLFDQVREAIPKLKTGMSEKEARRLLLLDRFPFITGCWSADDWYEFQIDNRLKRTLQVRFHSENGKHVIVSASLREAERIVAGFDADKK